MQRARLFLPSSKSRFAESSVRCVLCILMVCYSICGSVRAEDVLTAKPLAATPVQTIAAPEPSNEMPPNVAINLYQPPQDTSLANYSRGLDGQWQIPLQVDSKNPSVKLLVLGPQQPTLVEIAIFLEGEPFTAAREKLIDGLLDHATVESLVREAVSVPVPEDTAKLSLEEEKNEEAAEEKESKAETVDDETAKEDEKKEKESSGEKAKDDATKNNTETKTADKDGEKKEESETKTAKKDEPKEPEKPVVDVKTRQARSVAQRLVNYMASSDVKADREEIRWLLAEWTGGPALLTLGPAMNWQRIGFAPLWNALDVDADQNLSAAEIAAASERLSQADVDENSIVELEELFALRPRTATAPHSYPLLMVLDHETDWRHLYSQLQAAYGRRMTKPQGSPVSSTPALLERIASGDATLTPENLEVLLSQEADIKLRVTLGGKEKNENQVALLSAQPESFSSDEQTVTVIRGAEYFEVSASEQKEAEASEPTATQIAIGAVVDGYPLFRLVDRNGDRRLSPRECRNMAGALKALDLNGDGQIMENEKPTAIRLAVTSGPHVHEVLAQPTAAHRELASTRQTSPAKPNAAVPSWFTDMDRNRDGDLSRSEFLGTSEQFKKMDADGDGLVGSQEAAK